MRVSSLGIKRISFIQEDPRKVDIADKLKSAGIAEPITGLDDPRLKDPSNLLDSKVWKKYELKKGESFMVEKDDGSFNVKESTDPKSGEPRTVYFASASRTSSNYAYQYVILNSNNSVTRLISKGTDTTIEQIIVNDGKIEKRKAEGLSQ